MKTKITIFFCCIWTIGVFAQPKYNRSQMIHEKLGRGLVVFADPDYNDSLCLSWRLLTEDSENIAFNIYEDGKKINKHPIEQTTFLKIGKPQDKENTTFKITSVTNGMEDEISEATYTYRNNSPEGYLSIPLKLPEGNTTPDGQKYSYIANDASVGDMDGDGEYEIVLKWEPSNSRDNSHEGYTGNVLFDCYKTTGEQLWRIDLGHNIRAGAHYTQFMVYDFDGDNKAEIVMKTADGTIDGKGRCIGNPTADYRFTGNIDNNIAGKGRSGKFIKGRILDGPEYLTIFNGETGEAMFTTDYIPSRGKTSDWGDSYGNRCDRYLACIAYLDGIRPSVVMCRGYYTRTVLAAWNWNGKELTNVWTFDTNTPEWRHYAGQGNHNLRVADLDGDGCDEIVYGSMTVDNNGTGLYNTRMGHGDAMHLYAFYPDSDKLQYWNVHENRRDGSSLHDAATGEVIFQIPSRQDVGRGMAADIDPTNYGLEMWSIASGGIRNVKGELIAENVSIPINSCVWWDGDLLREMLDKGTISKYHHEEKVCAIIKNFRNENCSFNNGSKSNPCLSADIIGDWREEVIVRTNDNTELRIYTSNILTPYRFPTFMEDIPYRISVATQNVAYNQPPEPGFYFGAELKK
jgi:rhamnogalacturonan endolyase